MELRERLMQSADWCESHDDKSGIAWRSDSPQERLKHVAQDLRDAAEEISTHGKRTRNHFEEIARYSDRLNLLEEQLQMAKTEAKDVGEFRERERKEAELIVIGLRMAIQSIAHGLKGGA